jgi:uncharacterized protein (DUF362 family)
MPESQKSIVLLRGITCPSLEATVQDCLVRCDWESWVPRGGSVVLKPNLCTHLKEKAGVANTSKDVTEALCKALLTRTKNISIVEADHMRLRTPEVFEASGYVEMANRLGVQLVNLSDSPLTPIACDPIGNLDMPRLLLECDALISLPVLKTHALTYFTGSLKNQWGCVPRFEDRIRFHGRINEMLSSLHRILKPKFSLMDGILAMEGRGPVFGGTRELNVILASRDCVALDVTAMRLVGLEPRRCRHVSLAAGQGLGKIDADEIEVDGEWQKHATQFQPAPKDWANTAMFYFGRYPWFVKNVLGNDKLYYPVRGLVYLLRQSGILGG